MRFCLLHLLETQLESSKEQLEAIENCGFVSHIINAFHKNEKLYMHALRFLIEVGVDKTMLCVKTSTRTMDLPLQPVVAALTLKTLVCRAHSLSCTSCPTLFPVEVGGALAMQLSNYNPII